MTIHDYHASKVHIVDMLEQERKYYHKRRQSSCHGDCQACRHEGACGLQNSLQERG